MLRTLWSSIIILIASTALAQPGNRWEYRASPNTSLRNSGYFVIGDTAYFGGGFNGSTYLKTMYKYDIKNNKWSSMPTPPGRGRAEAVSFSLNGYGYWGAGWTGSSPSGDLPDFYRYDPKDGSWTQVDSFPSPESSSLFHFTLNGKGYAGGGSMWPANQFWEYDPVKDEWSAKASLPLNQLFRATGFSIGSYGYVVGGNADWGKRHAMFDSIYRYDPANDKWENLGEVPFVKAQYMLAFAHKGKAYIGGGWIEDNKEFWEFDPKDTSFRRLADLPKRTSGAATFSWNERMFVYSGLNNSQMTGEFWEYFPAESYIFIDSTNKEVYCEDDLQATVYFHSDGNFAPDNRFVIDLLDDYDTTYRVVLSEDATSPAHVTLPADFENGFNYWIRVSSTSPAINGSHSDTVLHILHYPQAPKLRLSNDTIHARYSGWYRWYKDGELLPGYDYVKFRKVKEPGVYTAVTDRGCPSAVSNAIAFGVSSVRDNVQSQPLVRVKSRNRLEIDASVAEVSIYTIDGRLVMQITAAQEVSIADLPSGSYLIKAAANDCQYTLPIVKF